MKITNTLIAGAGAVGLTVAHQIHSYNPNAVKILAKGERFERYSKNGLYVNDEKIDFNIVNADYTPEQYPELIIIACKNHHLETILEDMKNYVNQNTIILSLLNGITSEQIIAKKYPHAKIPLGMILGTDGQHGNEHAYYNLTGTIFFGDNQNDSINGKPQANSSEHVRTIAKFFEETNISYNVPENMLRKLWYKFLMNVGINQSSAILRLPYGPFQTQTNIPEALELVYTLQREVLAIAKHEGVGNGLGGDLTEEDILTCQKTVDSLTPTSRTSMCQDVLAKRKTEVELFSKTISELGKKHNIPTPANDLAYLKLRTMELSYEFVN